MIQIHPFKEKERGEGRSQLGGQWKEKEKLPMLGGQWKEKEKLFVLGGQWKEKEKFLSTSFHFSPTNFTQTFIVSFDLKLFLYHGFKLLLTHFLPFRQPINYDRTSQCYKSFSHSLPI
jgi:hypothetical protein